MNNQIDPQLQTMIRNMPEKTGRALEEWFEVLEQAGLEKHGQMVSHLKTEHGVTHGFANTITSLFRNQSESEPTPNDLVSSQFAGKKADLKPIYDNIIQEVNTFGDDVEIAPKKTYISLRRGKQFAIVKAATQTRVDLGLNLTNEDNSDRLEGGGAFGGMCSHLVRLESPTDVDAEVVSWLKQAYLSS